MGKIYISYIFISYQISSHIIVIGSILGISEVIRDVFLITDSTRVELFIVEYVSSKKIDF